jgi:hypothetical protein
MIFSENRYPLFGIMLWRCDRLQHATRPYLKEFIACLIADSGTQPSEP